MVNVDKYSIHAESEHGSTASPLFRFSAPCLRRLWRVLPLWGQVLRRAARSAHLFTDDNDEVNTNQGVATTLRTQTSNFPIIADASALHLPTLPDRHLACCIRCIPTFEPSIFLHQVRRANWTLKIILSIESIAIVVVCVMKSKTDQQHQVPITQQFSHRHPRLALLSLPQQRYRDPQPSKEQW